MTGIATVYQNSTFIKYTEIMRQGLRSSQCLEDYYEDYNNVWWSKTSDTYSLTQTASYTYSLYREYDSVFLHACEKEYAKRLILSHLFVWALTKPCNNWYI